MIPDRRRGIRERALSMSTFVLLLVFSLIGVAVTGDVTGFWGVVFLVCLIGLGVEFLMVRSQIALGPSLAADTEHVWIRNGGVLHPRSVRLAWTEISTVTLVIWHGRRDTVAHYLTFALTDDAAEELPTHPRLAKHARRLDSLFNAAFAISDHLKTVRLEEVVRTMREELAPDTVQFSRTAP